MRILYLVSDLQSGMGASLVKCVGGLRGRHEFLVCELTPRRPSGGEAVQATGARLVRIGKRGVNATIVLDLVRVARGFRPDVIQGFQIETNFYAWLVGRAVGARVVASFHGLESAFRGSMRPFLYCVLTGADRLACVSRAVARKCLGRVPRAANRLVVIPNGVEPHGFSQPRRAPRPGRTTVTCVANFYSDVKGHEHLVRAASLPGSDGFDLWLVGDGARLPAIRDLARDLGIADRVRFWGHRADIRELLARTDVFVLPSLSESCPHALLEAMAAGVPVIATGVGGVPEIVSHRSTGLLVPPARPAAIRDAIRELAGNSGLYERLSANALGHVRAHFRADAAARRYAELYEGLAPRT